MPKGGRGQFRKMASHLRVHTSFISQVFRGAKDLSLEQGAALCDFFGMSDDESEFFIALVEVARAGTPRLRGLIQKRIDYMRQRAGELSRMLPQDRKLSEAEQATFYSDWAYSGVRLTASLPGMASVDAIAERLDLPRQIVGNILKFLTDRGLLVHGDHGFALGPQRIHIDGELPFARCHHRNWRQKAANRLGLIRNDELFFSAPLTIGRGDMLTVRAEIQKLIERVSGIVDTTNPDTMACLNIDWVAL
jgi:hypothetical protein